MSALFFAKIWIEKISVVPMEYFCKLFLTFFCGNSGIVSGSQLRYSVRLIAKQQDRQGPCVTEYHRRDQQLIGHLALINDPNKHLYSLNWELCFRKGWVQDAVV